MKRQIPNSVSGALRWYIERAGLNVNQIAQASRVDPAGLYRFVRRKRGLTLESVDRIAAVLKLKLVRTED